MADNSKSVLSSSRSALFSILIHVGVGLLLFVGAWWPFNKQQPAQQVSTIQATAVDLKAIEAEKQRKLDEEQARLDAIAEVERKEAERVEQERLEQERVEKEKQEAIEREERRIEEERLALERKEQEEKERQEKERKEKEQREKEEKERKEKEAREKEERERKEKERKAREERERKEKERKAREAQEKALQERLAKERAEQARAAEASNYNAQAIRNYGPRIVRHIENIWIKPQQKLAVTLNISVRPDGTVISVDVARSSGNRQFDRSATVAVQKASPLPMPDLKKPVESSYLLQPTFRVN